MPVAGASATGSSSRLTRKWIGEERIQDIQGVVKTGVEVLGVVAAATQNVPYLSIISGSLTEIIKICDEVNQCKDEWKSVAAVVGQLQLIVEASREQCETLQPEAQTVPRALVEPLRQLESCIKQTRKALDACRPAYTDSGERRKGFGVTLSTLRNTLKRKHILSSVQRCRIEMDDTLKFANTSLNFSHTLALERHERKLDALLLKTGRSPPERTSNGEETVTIDLTIEDAPARGSPSPESSQIIRYSPQSHHSSTRTVQIREEQVVQIINWHALGNQVHTVISRFGVEDQAIVWRALAMLLLGLTDPIRGSEVVTRAEHQIIQQTISVTVTFLILFMSWKLHCLSRPLSTGQIVLVDFLGNSYVLEQETFATWENTHRFLTRAFRGRPGLSHVKNGHYALGNSERLLIAPEEWSNVVQPDMHITMSAISRENPSMCPYCQTPITGSERLYYDGHRIICSNTICGREYAALEMGVYKPALSRKMDIVESLSDGSVPEEIESSEDTNQTLPNPSDPMKLFKRVLVRYTRVLAAMNTLGNFEMGASNIPIIVVTREEYA
ncbi:unnamed protein product [Peniophora sp. CBMAI 1063]|nr:unnamed protein product [Peniophora sp. CBMAI 1063]